jgi:hypothetical protein
VNTISQYAPQLGAIAGVIVLLTVGASRLIPGAKASAPLMWVAWAVYAVCGLVLGWALSSVVTWLTSGGPGAKGVIGSIFAIPAVLFGWHAVYLLVALIRDLADRKPDEDARKAALWVPTLLPAGVQAVWATVTHPQSVVIGVIAVVNALITIIYAHRIVGAALKGSGDGPAKSKSARQKAWSWFAVAVCLLSGLMTLPLVLYTDVVVSHLIPASSSGWLVAARFLIGVIGGALLVAAIADLKDRVPDQHVRRFLSYGLPLLIAFGGIAMTIGITTASNGGQNLIGSVK